MNEENIDLDPDEIVVIHCLDEFRKDKPKFVRNALYEYMVRKKIHLSKGKFYKVMRKFEDDRIIVSTGEMARKDINIYRVTDAIDIRNKYIEARNILKLEIPEIEGDNDILTGFNILEKIAKPDYIELDTPELIQSKLSPYITQKIVENIIVTQELSDKVTEIIDSVKKKEIVILVGEAGIGKTLLLYVICKRLIDAGEIPVWPTNKLIQIDKVVVFDDIKRLLERYYEGVSESILDITENLTKGGIFTSRTHDIIKIIEEVPEITRHVKEIRLERWDNKDIRELYLSYTRDKVELKDNEIDSLIKKSDGLPLYIRTFIDYCKSMSKTSIPSDLLEKVPPGMAELITHIIISEFSKNKIDLAILYLISVAHEYTIHIKQLEEAEKIFSVALDSIPNQTFIDKYYSLFNIEDRGHGSYLLAFSHPSWGEVVEELTNQNSDLYEILSKLSPSICQIAKDLGRIFDGIIQKIRDINDVFQMASYNEISKSIKQLEDIFYIDDLIITTDISIVLINTYPLMDFEKNLPPSWLEWMNKAKGVKECDIHTLELAISLDNAASHYKLKSHNREYSKYRRKMFKIKAMSIWNIAYQLCNKPETLPYLSDYFKCVREMGEDGNIIQIGEAYLKQLDEYGVKNPYDLFSLRIDSTPKEIWIPVEKANIFLQIGKENEAKKCFEQIVIATQEVVDNLFGATYPKRNDNKKIRSLTRKDYHFLWEYLNALIHLERFEEAFEIIDNFISKFEPNLDSDKGGYDILLTFADFTNRLEKPAKSIELCKKAIELEPEIYSPYFTLAKAYLINDDSEKAVKAFRHFLIKKDKSDQILFAAVEKGDYSSNVLEKELIGCLVRTPFDILNIFKKRINYLKKIGKFNEALRVARDGLDLFPRNQTLLALEKGIQMKLLT